MIPLLLLFSKAHIPEGHFGLMLKKVCPSQAECTGWYSEQTLASETASPGLDTSLHTVTLEHYLTSRGLSFLNNN